MLVSCSINHISKVIYVHLKMKLIQNCTVPFEKETMIHTSHHSCPYQILNLLGTYTTQCLHHSRFVLTHRAGNVCFSGCEIPFTFPWWLKFTHCIHAFWLDNVVPRWLQSSWLVNYWPFTGMESCLYRHGKTYSTLGIQIFPEGRQFPGRPNI